MSNIHTKGSLPIIIDKDDGDNENDEEPKEEATSMETSSNQDMLNKHSREEINLNKRIEKPSNNDKRSIFLWAQKIFLKWK